jgi:nucleotide-binding universal stress UspA family protein
MNREDEVMDELYAREQRAQDGVLQFAEEMQAIRQGDLYPNAGKTDAWKTYCQDRWGMSERNVRRVIAALPVMQRTHASAGTVPTISAAEAVADLPEPVQDAILDDAPKRDVVKARAKAAQKAIKYAEQVGREPDTEDVIVVAIVKLDKIAILVSTIGRMLRDEGTVTDEEIASLLEEASR